MHSKQEIPRNRLHILYQDNYLAVVSKPSGMLSISYPGSRDKTALDVLNNLLKPKGRQRAAVVHRLDRDTSGLMMFALSGEAKGRIMDSWQTMVTERIYVAVAEQSGTPLPDGGTIDAPLAQNKYHNSFVPSPGMKNCGRTESAVTHFRVIERGKLFDLVELELETGRKNQIRAHLSYLRHPIAGDSTYRAKTDPFGRLALHARTLAFIHPYTNECLRFEAEEPAEWRKTVLNPSRGR